MRIVPERRPWIQLLTVVLAFTFGPLLGLRLGMALTPASDLVQAVGVFAFLLIFVAGTLFWSGLGIVVVIGGGLLKLLRGRRPGVEGLEATDRVVPPGYRVFPILGGVLGGGVGVLAGLVSGWGVGAAACVWGAAGLAYGLGLWWAAHHGYLPFPEPE